MNATKETKFEIKFQAPLNLIPTPSSLMVSKRVKWRVSEIDIKETNKKEKVFCLTLSINQEDINDKTNTEELRGFRNAIISLLSFVTLCPIQLLSKGTFTFHIGNDKYKQTSLGPMKYSPSPTPLSGIKSIIEGLALTNDYMAALYFIEKAVGAEEILYEFINIAICCELIIGRDSPEPRSINPKCKNGHILTNCPACNCTWLIPSPLKNRAEFLMGEPLAGKFSKARNIVFHGDPSQINKKFLNNLKDLNTRLLICLRNYLGKKIQLPLIEKKDLSSAIIFKGTDPIVSVYFTLKKEIKRKKV